MKQGFVPKSRNTSTKRERKALKKKNGLKSCDKKKREGENERRGVEGSDRVKKREEYRESEREK